jgi:hypothetical protein
MNPDEIARGEFFLEGAECGSNKMGSPGCMKSDVVVFCLQPINRVDWNLDYPVACRHGETVELLTPVADPFQLQNQLSSLILEILCVELRSRQPSLGPGYRALLLPGLGRLNESVQHCHYQEIDQRFARDGAGESSREHIAYGRKGGSPNEQRRNGSDEEGVQETNPDPDWHMEEHPPRMLRGKRQPAYDEKDEGRKNRPRPPHDTHLQNEMIPPRRDTL